ALISFVLPSGYFGPLSSRVRGLFVQHTRTGNPLVDSVAEHQPASQQAYYQYLNVICNIAPIGFLMVLFKITDQSAFLLLYAMVTYFFSAKMVRLIILTGPIAAILGGLFIGSMFDWSVAQLITGASTSPPPPADEVSKKAPGSSKKSKKNSASTTPDFVPSELSDLYGTFSSKYSSVEGQFFRKIGALIFGFALFTYGKGFGDYCDKMAVALSNPSIMFKAQLRSGQTIIIDDYREAYWWLRDNTPSDSRIMAWWDYGYQITGIANRTTIADGNTWNHEHIALLGRTLTAPEKEGHRAARHLADYILIWAGGGGDDLAKR
ncbi:hypothetical protein TrRE_jg10188, partial [Triparma retinervis]